MKPPAADLYVVDTGGNSARSRGIHPPAPAGTHHPRRHTRHQPPRQPRLRGPVRIHAPQPRPHPRRPSAASPAPTLLRTIEALDGALNNHAPAHCLG